MLRAGAGSPSATVVETVELEEAGALPAVEAVFRLRGAQELDVGGTRLLELGEQRLGDFEGGGGSSFLYCGVEGGLQLLCRA